MSDPADQLVPRPPHAPLAPHLPALHAAAAAADAAATAALFDDYHQRLADETQRAQQSDLQRFAMYLVRAGVDLGHLGTAAERLYGVPDAWRGISWGLVSGFVQWQRTTGFAPATLNRALSTVKVHAALAAQAGAIPADTERQIQRVRGYSAREITRLSKQAGDPTKHPRRGHKKAQAVLLTTAQARQLKQQPITPQGRRDALLVCLLLDHGLRVSEVVGIMPADLDLATGMLRFYRPKVVRTQTHKLTADALRAALAYVSHAPTAGPLLRASRKDGALTHAGLSTRGATGRIRLLGEAIGVPQLSAHDLRHYWATAAARAGTAIDRLTDAGGWRTPMTPLTKYIEPTAVANTGVRLEE